ncbi:glycosyltransferase [Streptomyces sp. 796.1]|uniref:glycosyltransferase n=1 Tax=Streptomyces sp. 796.1 TaxID=3163029 RepID=UPI0039C94381
MDICVAPSTEEAFGLAVVEALAAGLPVLHVTCPAIDELPQSEAPGAHRIGPGAPELTAALRAHAARGAERLPVPPAVHRYAITRTAGQLMDLYAELYATEGRADRAGKPRRLRRGDRFDAPTGTAPHRPAGAPAAAPPCPVGSVPGAPAAAPCAAGPSQPAPVAGGVDPRPVRAPAPAPPRPGEPLPPASAANRANRRPGVADGPPPRAAGRPAPRTPGAEGATAAQPRRPARPYARKNAKR